MSMYYVVCPKESHAYLLAVDRLPRTKLRGFLEERGIRPKRELLDILPIPIRLSPQIAAYQLRGDALLKVRALKLPAMEWRDLVLTLTGQMSMQLLTGRADGTLLFR